MPDESDLRKMFASASAPNSLDPNRVIRQARLRRLPRQLGAGAAGVLAVAAIAVLAVQPGRVAPPSSVTMEQQAEGSTAAGPAADSTIKRAPADKINLCTGPVADVAPSTLGLQLEVVFAASAPVGTAAVEGIVRLTNTSAVTVTGTSPVSPALTLSRNGITLWHSNGPVDSSAVVVELAPGESVDYEASFVPVQCSVDDDLAEEFRPDLPALQAGSYELSAAMDFMPDALPTDGSTLGLDLVTGPRSPITLG